MTTDSAPRTEAGRRLARHIFTATEAHCEADILAIEAEASRPGPISPEALAEALHKADVGCEWNPVGRATHDGNHETDARAILARLAAPAAQEES